VVIPIGDLNPTRRRPHLNWLFLALNIGIFAWQRLALDTCAELAFVYRFAVVPQEVVSGSPLPTSTVDQLLGGCPPPDGGKLILLALVTSMFLHADIFHLIGNMLFLFVFGDNVEDRLGKLRYLLFYLGGGALAAATYVALQPGSVMPLIGASGGVAAILGAYLVLFPRAKVLTYVPFPLYLLALVIPKVRIRLWLLIFAIVKMPAWLLLGGWLAYQFVGVTDPRSGNIAYEAHIAGFAAGIVLLLLLDRFRMQRGKPPLHPVRGR